MTGTKVVIFALSVSVAGACPPRASFQSARPAPLRVSTSPMASEPAQAAEIREWAELPDLSAESNVPARTGLPEAPGKAPAEAELLAYQDPSDQPREADQHTPKTSPGGDGSGERADENQEARQARAERASERYEEAVEALDERQWDKAIDGFNEVAAGATPKSDGALYWKAYAQNKLGQRAAALETLGQLRAKYPRSRWLNDAKALEVEVRQASGQSVLPEIGSDEDLKLIAISSLLRSDPQRAMPMLERVLEGSQPVKVKERALFVLAQSGTPQARQVIARIAKGNSSPSLQMQALHYLALYGGPESREALADVYASTSDPDVKRSILRGFMINGDRNRLLTVARGEKSPELRAQAVQQLGVMGARDELWQLYQGESSTEVRQAILHALFIGGDTSRLLEVARTATDPELRRSAVQKLGMMGASRTGDTLASLYAAERDPEVRKAVIDALFVEGNARALVAIARRETDPRWKRRVVEKLSIMNSKDANDYMMDLLSK